MRTAYWPISLTAVLRGRQIPEFEASPVYITSSRPAGDTVRHYLKTNKKNNNKSKKVALNYKI